MRTSDIQRFSFRLRLVSLANLSLPRFTYALNATARAVSG
jgi:hypothetical protein